MKHILLDNHNYSTWAMIAHYYDISLAKEKCFVGYIEQIRSIVKEKIYTIIMMDLTSGDE